MTKPLARTRIRQGVFAGKCAAGMISPPRQHASCSSKKVSVCAAIASLRQRARMRWTLKHPVIRRLERADNRTPCGTPSQDLSPGRLLYFWIFTQKAAVISGGSVDSRDAHRVARKFAGTSGRCRFSGHKHLHPRASRITLRVLFFTWPDRPPRVSFALAMVLQRTHPLSGLGSSLGV